MSAAAAIARAVAFVEASGDGFSVARAHALAAHPIVDRASGITASSPCRNSSNLARAINPSLAH